MDTVQYPRAARGSSNGHAAVPINPPDGVLGTQNAILSGTGRRYYVPDYEGPLSIKTLLSGCAVWETPERRFTLQENCYLVLNDRQRYTITIDSSRPVSTFCIFFERGFVEDAFRSEVTPGERLLYEGGNAAGALEFTERIEPGETRVLRAVTRLRSRIERGAGNAAGLEDCFFDLAKELVQEQLATEAARRKLSTLRPSTRIELHKRLLRGRDFLLSAAAQNVGLKEAARAACLSPFHFHRSFVQVFGATPHRYLRLYRMERARHLLATTRLPVTEICLECGFESLGSFSALFRRNSGLSPRGYRQRFASK
jgi:AraC family transcriptional regulator